jgi:Family of unknown function (DUF6498)
MSRALHYVSLLIGLVGNLIPLYGILFWNWDTFQLLMLYWTETVIVAFWTLRRLARLSADERGTLTVNGNVRPATAFSLVGFFALHSGAFILGHLLFLWLFFSSAWLKTIHGVGDFFYGLFVANGIWAALALFFITHWVSYLVGQNARPERPADRSKPDPVGGIVGPLYVRIVTMQVAIIFGAWVANWIGSLAPLVIVIVLKTLADLGTLSRIPALKNIDFSKNKASIEM